MQTLQSNPLLPITPQSLQLTYYPVNCRTLANPVPPNPLANAGLTLRPNFHSCINSTPVSRSETRHMHPAIPDRRPDSFVGPQRSDRGDTLPYPTGACAPPSSPLRQLCELSASAFSLILPPTARNSPQSLPDAPLKKTTRMPHPKSFPPLMCTPPSMMASALSRDTLNR